MEGGTKFPTGHLQALAVNRMTSPLDSTSFNILPDVELCYELNYGFNPQIRETMNAVEGNFDSGDK